MQDSTPNSVPGRDGLVDPLNNGVYLVRPFPPIDRADFRRCIRLMESFERRFLHTVEGGGIPLQHEHDLDEYIRKLQKEYHDKSPELREVVGAKLSVALLHRGVTKAKKHMEMSMQKGMHQPEYIHTLMREVEHDLTASSQLFHLVRRRRGHEDIDHVLAEMKGEPFVIFSGTLPNAQGVLEQFRANRMRKAAMAMQSIDAVSEAGNLLVKGDASLCDKGVDDLISTLAEKAKTRLQLQRDDPEFVLADEQLMVARNRLLSFKPPEDGAMVLMADRIKPKQKVSATSMELLQDACDLIYDMAIIRVPRDVSAGHFKAHVEEHLSHLQQARQSARYQGG